MSKEEIEAHGFSEPCVVVSIRGPKSPKARIASPFIDEVLWLTFSDSVKGVLRYPRQNTESRVIRDMDISHARAIVQFVKKWEEKVGLVYVHCLGGVSRSRGVVCGLMFLDGLDFDQVAKMGDPNPLCQRLVIKAGIEDEVASIPNDYSYCQDCNGCVVAGPNCEEPAYWCRCSERKG